MSSVGEVGPGLGGRGSCGCARKAKRIFVELGGHMAVVEVELGPARSTCARLHTPQASRTPGRG